MSECGEPFPWPEDGYRPGWIAPSGRHRMKRQKHERSWLHKFNMDAALRYSWESRASALSGDVMGMVHYMHLTLNYLAECGCGSASWPQTVHDVADFKTHADFTGCVLRELRPELFPNNQ